MNRKNCWEVKGCGREPGGKNSRESGVCPAATDTRLNGANNGKNAGRSCWIVAGTLCGGKVQGTFAEKYSSCVNCDFYLLVKTEESVNFETLVSLYQRLAMEKPHP